MKRPLAVCSIIGLLAVALAGDDPVPCPMPDMCDAPPPDAFPALTDPVPKVEGHSGRPNAKYGGIRTWWQLSGSKIPLKWASDAIPPVIVKTWGWRPVHDPEAMNATIPREFDVRVTQGVYEANMWVEDPAEEFAERVIFMFGAINSALSHVQSGLGLTRASDTDLEYNKLLAAKNVIGQTNTAMILRGGSAWDAFTAIGQANFVSVAFDNWPDDDTETVPTIHPQYKLPPEDWAASFTRFHGAIMQASESTAYISRPFTESGSGGALATFADGRNQTLKEDDKWGPVPTVLHEQIGLHGKVLLDGKMFDSYVAEGEALPNAPRCTQAGFIDTAYALKGFAGGIVEKSWINAGFVWGYQTVFGFDNKLGVGLDRGICICPEQQDEDERCCSVIRTYGGIRAAAPFDYSAGCQVSILQSACIVCPEMGMNSGGGAPAQVAALLPTNDDGIAVAESIAIERHASIIARGHSVFGDGYVSDPATVGYDTDVMHINGVLRLAPRTSPPVLSPDLPPHARAGIVYFDAARACLRVSVPVILPTDDPADWRNARVAWVDVARDLSAINPATDTVGSAALAVASAQDIRDAITATASGTAAGDPAFAAPALVVKDVQPIAGHGAEIVFEVHGLAAEAPVLYWRLAKNPARGTGATQWTLVEAEAVTALPGADPAVREYAALLAGDIPVPPRERSDDLRSVQLMALNPATGQTSGAAFTARF